MLIVFIIVQTSNIRKKNNLTQDQLAKKMNTTQASYSHYENATNMIPTVFLYNLTKIYKPFSIDGLLGRKKLKKKLMI